MSHWLQDFRTTNVPVHARSEIPNFDLPPIWSVLQMSTAGFPSLRKETPEVTQSHRIAPIYTSHINLLPYLSSPAYQQIHKQQHQLQKARHIHLTFHPAL